MTGQVQSSPGHDDGTSDFIQQKLGLSGDAATAYARDVVAADFEPGGNGAARKVTSDLGARNIVIAEAELRAKMGELMVQAVALVKAGT